MPGVGEVVHRSPVAAVNEEDDRLWTFSLRDANVDEMVGIGTVIENRVRRGYRLN